MSRIRLHFAYALFASFAITGGTFAQDPADEPDDRLPPEERRLVAGLIQRGMPELVEEALAGAPTMHRVNIARAYAAAAIKEPSPATRDAFFTRAAAEYRGVIDLGKKSSWLRGERRRFDVAQWRVELGDMILRHWIAGDMDQFEITSGLKYDSERLVSRLKEAHECYVRAGETLTDLDIGLRTDEERYLLLGIGQQIGELLDQQHVNRAWTEIYWAMAGGPDTPGRSKMLDNALAAFDGASRRAPDAERKYQALLGAGIALRESARFDEAFSALERVVDSTASLAVTARAEFELGKSYMAADRFDDARRRLQRLGARSTDRLRPRDAGAAFYIRLAPLIHGYTHMKEAAKWPENDTRRAAALEKARRQFESIASRGGSWPRMVQVYLDAMAGKERSIDQLSDVELLLLGGEAMTKKEYADAERVWRILLDRPESAARHHEARFNLAVCLFQRRDVRGAAGLFLEEVKSKPPPELSERAHEYAYRSWRQLAAQSKLKEDYLKLADAAESLANTLPHHADAAEARWIAALSLEEGGDFRRASRTYGDIMPDSKEYWLARHNQARCEQRLYESMPGDASESRRSAAARSAVDAWQKLAQDLIALDAPAPGQPLTGGRKKSLPANAPLESQRKDWVVEARTVACSLLAGDDLRQYREALDILESMRTSPRVLGLKIRCLQALGDIKEANQVLETYLKNNPADELGSVLVSLAAEMEAEVKRLQKAGRMQEARRMAGETLPTIRHLLAWIESRPEHMRHVSVVRFSLANMLDQAGKLDDAMREMEGLMDKHPSNGAYLIAAARLQEKIGEEALASDREDTLNKAERLWEKLLNDSQLRTNAPNEYWEARYHWLRHQLRHGKANEVVKGIETEQAWRPDLGGPPWQGLLLELAEEARTSAEAP